MNENWRGGRFEFQLCLFLLSFCGHMALHKRNRGFRKSTSAAPVHDGTNLLIFTAGLTGPFRFVSTVTIMQHAIRLSALDLIDRYRSQRGNPTAKAEGI